MESTALHDEADEVTTVSDPLCTQASQCGFTPQYKDLQALQDEFGEKGFSVLAFPCNRELHLRHLGEAHHATSDSSDMPSCVYVCLLCWFFGWSPGQQSSG